MWAGWMLTQPRLRVPHHFHPPAFNASPSRFRGWMLGKVVVEVEPLIESGSQRLAVENDCSNKSGCVIALLAKQLRQRWIRRRQRHAKIGHSVCAWQQPRENAGVRSICDRARGERMLEADAISCQSVQGGRLDPLIAVAVHVVGSQGVDRYNKK